MSEMNKNTFLIPVFLFIASLGLGLSINHMAGKMQLRGDQPEYHLLASIYSNTGKYGYPDRMAYRAPTYPISLGIIYRIFGAKVTIGRYYQSFLGALMVLLAYFIGLTLGNKIIGTMSALFVMVDSYWWLNQLSLLQENLFSVLIATSFLLILISIKYYSARKRKLAIVISGVIFGISLLTKPFLAPLLVIIWLIPIFAFNHRKEVLKLTLLFLLATVLTITPWSYRNYQIFHHFIPFTTGSGAVLFGSHCEETFGDLKGDWINKPITPAWSEWSDIMILSPEKREVAIDNLYKRKAYNEIRKHSFHDLGILIIHSWLRFWSPSTFFGASTLKTKILKMILIIINSIILISFILALITNKPYIYLVIIVILSALVTVTIFYGGLRFRYPLSPIISSYASVFMYDIIKKIKYKQTNLSLWVCH